MATMNVKNGTRTISSAPQNEIIKRDPTQNLSAQDKAKVGDQDLGEILNKISDPNWVDPSKRIRSVGNDKMDKDAFMKLMLAQMKNQDPTNPMKSHEMAAQLAQFTSVEQMQNMNTTLTEMKDGQKPAESFQVLQFIGKAVSGDSAKVLRSRGDKSHDFNFSLPDNSAKASIRIRNEAGEIIRTIDMNNLKEGENKTVWNGADDKGNAAPAGEYTFFVEAKNAAGTKMNVKTSFEGIITGVNYTKDGSVLMVGNQSIRLSDVKKIVDPSLMKNDQISKPDLKTTPQGTQTVTKAAQKEFEAGDATPQPGAQIMTSVGMSNQMMSKLTEDIAGKK